jgi:TPR repeat protein
MPAFKSVRPKGFHVGKVMFCATVLFIALSGCERKPPVSQQEQLPKLEAIRPKAEAGDPEAQRLMGAIFARGAGVKQDYKEAAKWYRQAAEKGNAAAQTALGELCEAGQGVPRNEAAAATWYRKAADQGYAPAQYAPADPAQAVKWYRAAAEQGDSLSQYNLGMRYMEAKGVAPDPVEAWKWLALAEAGGITDAKNAKDAVSSNLNSDQLARAKALVRDFKPHAPDKTQAPAGK